MLNYLAKKIFERQESGININSLNKKQKELYRKCILKFVIKKRYALEEVVPDLKSLSNEHLANDIEQLIKEGFYEFIIDDYNNFVVLIRKQDKYKIMHIELEGITEI